MAETAKILNPSKKVLLRDLEAGCSLADFCPPVSFADKEVPKTESVFFKESIVWLHAIIPFLV